MKDFLEQLNAMHTLTSDEAYVLQSQILMGHHHEDELISLFESLARMPLTRQMIHGFYLASLNAMVTLEGATDTLDIVGTGGDGIGTPNISTLAALVCSYLGVPIAKHGNRSASGVCGSADVLEMCGVNIHMNTAQAQFCLKETNFTFLFAPLYHPAFRYVRTARTRYSKPTYFNILGPLLHPGNARYQMIGVRNIDAIPLMSAALTQFEKEVYFVHGCDGMDEITVNNESRLYRYSTKSHQMTISACDPTLYDCRHDTFPTIQTRSDAVDLFLQTLAGIAPPSINSLVALNAAYAMLLYSPENTISEGVKEVKKALQSGKVKNHLHRIARISQL